MTARHRPPKPPRPVTTIWPVLGCYSGAVLCLAMPLMDWLWPVVDSGPAAAGVGWASCGLMAAFLGRVYQRRWQYCRQRPTLNRAATDLVDVVMRMNPGHRAGEWRKLHNADEQVIFVCCRADRAGPRWELARMADDDATDLFEGLEEENRTVTGYWETFVVRDGHPIMLFQNVDSARRADGKLVSAGARAPLVQRAKAVWLRMSSAAILATEEDLAVALRQLAGAHDLGGDSETGAAA